MRRATFVFVFLVVALDMLALGIIVPILPKLVLEFEGGDSAGAAAVYGLFGTVWAAMQFLCAPVLGALSDRFGRRRVILMSCLGLGLDYFLMAWAPTLWWLFVGRVISGITSSSFATAYAYIADVTPEGERAGRYGLLGAAFGIGFIIGPALGGLLGSVALRLPFWVAGGLSLLGALYGYFVLPESLPPERRAAFEWRRANPVGALELLRAGRTLAALATVAFLYRAAHDALPSMIVQVGLVGRAVQRFGEHRTMLAGLTFGALSFGVYGLAPSGALFVVGILPGALFGLTYPSLLGLLTRQVGDEEQGRLQGAVASLMGIAGVLAPVLFTQTFALAVGPLQFLQAPGAPFLLAGLLLLVAMPVARRAAPPAARAASRA